MKEFELGMSMGVALGVWAACLAFVAADVICAPRQDRERRYFAGSGPYWRGFPTIAEARAYADWISEREATDERNVRNEREHVARSHFED